MNILKQLTEKALSLKRSKKEGTIERILPSFLCQIKVEYYIRIF